jgi:hypothetical protein
MKKIPILLPMAILALLLYCNKQEVIIQSNPAMAIVSGFISDYNTETAIDSVNILYYVNDSTKPYQSRSDSAGTYRQIIFGKGPADIKIVCEKEGYRFQDTTIYVPKEFTEFKIDFELHPE